MSQFLRKGWKNSVSRLTLSLAALACLVPAGCSITDIRFWWTEFAQGGEDGADIGRMKGICYFKEVKKRTKRHELDVFCPKGKKDCPVVVLVHGGAWMVGDNRCCGLYTSVGEFLAGQGIVAVLPNYRLSPNVKHPEHVKDVARAVAWAKKNAAKYGGRADNLFLIGHSAGGHLVCLLATDPQYLKEVGVNTKNIKGVISICGVYDIPPENVDFTFGSKKGNAVRWDKMFPLRKPNHPPSMTLPGIPASVDIFGPAFGDNAKARKKASPIYHVRPGLPPFLLLNADNDLPTLPKMAKEFNQALKKHGCTSEHLIIRQRNHNSIMFHAYRKDDPVAKMILSFIRHANLK